MFKKLLFITRPLRYSIDRFFYMQRGESSSLLPLKNKYKNKPMLVVGNGPSLNDTPFESFVGIPAIGMNKIDLLYPQTDWRPSFVLTANTLVVKQHWQSMLETGIDIYLSSKSRFFVPGNAKNKFKYFLSNSNSDFSRDITKGIGSAGTVTYTALQFAYYCGANPVILFGVDHSFKMDGNPNEIKKRESEDVNHFHPDYFAKGQYWGVPNLEKSEIGFKNAKDAFELDGRKIFDATIGGKLDVFEKIDVDEAKKLCGKI